MYWPKEGMEIYGHIQVKLVKEDVLAMYTIRTMKIVHLKVHILFIYKKSGYYNNQNTSVLYHAIRQ